MNRHPDRGVHRTGSVNEALGHLHGLRADGHSVLSLYLNFDPSEFPNLRERHMQVDALLEDAERGHVSGENGSASREDRLVLREDIERVRESPGWGLPLSVSLTPPQP
jgi:hypothetical protein